MVIMVTLKSTDRSPLVGPNNRHNENRNSSTRAPRPGYVSSPARLATITMIHDSARNPTDTL